MAKSTIEEFLLIWFLIVFLGSAWCDLWDFNICHENFNFNPGDGIIEEPAFPWLGFVQYVHVTTGKIHNSKAPRVVLIHRQFAIATVQDMLVLPKNHRIGYILFGDYEQEEDECGLTRSDIKDGIKCPRVYIQVLAAEVTTHPEYARFSVTNSISLIKLQYPLMSHYLVPVCLPSFEERQRKTRHKEVHLIDYVSTVPKDFDVERIAKKTLKLHTSRDCKKSKLKNEEITQVLCTTGCGIRPGAPILSRSPEGRYEVLGLSVGGSSCWSDAMRSRLNTEPPIYIDIYPYVTWLINVITAHYIPKAYPQRFRLVEGGASMSMITRQRRKQRESWKGREYLSGDLCFRSKATQKVATFFYHERFHVNGVAPAKLKVVVKVHTGRECRIMCCRIALPNRLCTPIVKGVGTSNLTIELNTELFPMEFGFAVGLSGKPSGLVYGF